MTAREMIMIGDFLTEAEVKKAIKLYLSDKHTFTAKCLRQIIKPNMKRIVKTLGKECDPLYLAYALEFAMMSSATPENLTEAEN